MQCKYVKPLFSEKFLQEYENEVKIKLPQEFCEFIKLNNGGKPKKELYDTCKVKERAIKHFLSFNKENKENVWRAIKTEGEFVGKYAPFAIDNFGNWIVFSKEGKVLFYNHEDKITESIANSFSEFLQSLY